MDLAGRLIQDQRPRIWMGEIEHRVDGTGDGIEGAVADPLSMQPIVLDEAQNRSLIGQTMVDKVAPGKGRNH